MCQRYKIFRIYANINTPGLVEVLLALHSLSLECEPITISLAVIYFLGTLPNLTGRVPSYH